MNLKKIILASLLLAVGLILHYVVPGLPLGNMKPDPFLSMMFIAILLCDDYKMTLVIGLASGFLTAMTTTFPGGQIPNIVDKLMTSHIVFLMLQLAKNRIHNQLKMLTVSILGTIISGSVFLGTALILFGLPAPFMALFIGVVLPATAANTVVVLLLCNAISAAMSRAAFKFN
jgi:hypothetical protein